MNKKYNLLLFFATIVISFIIFENNSYAASSDKQTLSDAVIILEGNVDNHNYRYYVAEDIKKGKNQFVLDIESSSLLMKPSSLTVKIDGEKVKTYALDGKKPTNTITLNLAKEYLEKGTHEVVFEFYGSIKDGACVENSTSGNWLKIKPSSYLQVAENVVSSSANLSDYPSKFVASNAKTNVVIPNDADELTVDAALKVTSYLKKQAQKPNQIQLTFENDQVLNVQNIIYVGEKDSFSSKTNKIVEAAKTPVIADALNMSIFNEKTKKSVQTIMVIQADSSKNLNDRIMLVADRNFTEQLQKQQLSIKTIPDKNKANNGAVRFIDMDIRDITLSNGNSTSPHYYYQIPSNLQQDKNIELNLQLIKSSIFKTEETELIVLVNDIPHPVDLKNIKETEAGELFVKVVVDPQVFNNKSLLDLQFTLNGSAMSDPCAVNMEDMNLFISENSELQYTVSEDKQLHASNLNVFPAFITISEKPTYVVVNRVEKNSLVDLVSLYTAATVEGKVSNLTLKTADSVNEKDLAQQHVIVIGTVDKLDDTLLTDNPLVHDGKIDIAKAGFIEETATRYATIQKNPWNEDYIALQFNQVQSNGKITPSSFLQQLQALDVDASIAVQNDARDIFTNSQSFEVAKTKLLAQQLETKTSFNWESIVLFVGLLIIVAIVIIVMVKRRKKK